MPGDELVWFGPYPEYNTNELILSLIKRVRDDQGQLLGLLMVDMSFDSLQQALQRTVGGNQAALYLTLRDSGQLVVGSNMDLLADHPIEQHQASSGSVWMCCVMALSLSASWRTWLGSQYLSAARAVSQQPL